MNEIKVQCIRCGLMTKVETNEYHQSGGKHCPNCKGTMFPMSKPRKDWQNNKRKWELN